jgi:hypothetical protein
MNLVRLIVVWLGAIACVLVTLFGSISPLDVQLELTKQELARTPYFWETCGPMMLPEEVE